MITFLFLTDLKISREIITKISVFIKNEFLVPNNMLDKYESNISDDKMIEQMENITSKIAEK